jgi:phosphatidylglycerophosphate synthase
MARLGFSPNGVSLLGLGFAAAGAGAILAGWWWVAAVGVQARLLCNMLDGLIAVEHGKGDKLGGFFNEVPDRAEDVMLLLAAGYAAGGEWGATAGWAAALLALGTAYLRQAGGAMGLPQDFCGPMAKQHRMFVLTVTLLVAGLLSEPGRVLETGLGVIVAGAAITAARRIARMLGALKAR